MMLWLMFGGEALIILLIFIKMLSKRRSFSSDEEEQPSTPDTSLLNEALSSDEQWEKDETKMTQ